MIYVFWEYNGGRRPLLYYYENITDTTIPITVRNRDKISWPKCESLLENRVEAPRKILSSAASIGEEVEKFS